MCLNVELEQVLVAKQEWLNLINVDLGLNIMSNQYFTENIEEKRLSADARLKKGDWLCSVFSSFESLDASWRLRILQTQYLLKKEEGMRFIPPS